MQIEVMAVRVYGRLSSFQLANCLAGLANPNGVQVVGVVVVVVVRAVEAVRVLHKTLSLDIC